MMTTLLAPRDAARRLGMSVSRLVQLEREGALRAMRDSANRRLYDPDVVEAFAKAREAKKATRQESQPSGPQAVMETVPA